MSNLLQTHRERIGRRVKTARSEANLTLDGMAARVGTTRQHLIKLEKGQHAPRAEMLQKIADATGKDPSFFQGDDSDDEESSPMTFGEAMDQMLAAHIALQVDRRVEQIRRELSAA